MLGVLRVGGVVSGASPAYNVEEMTYALKTADAKFLMTHPASMEVATAAAKNAGIPKENLFLLEGTMEGYTTIKELIEMGKGFGEQGQVPSFKIPAGKTNFDVCGYLSFSSGTTGLPKAVSLPLLRDTMLRSLLLTICQVMIAHQNAIAQCLQVQSITPPNAQKGPRGAAALPHHRTRPRAAPAPDAQRRGHYAPIIHHEVNARHSRRIPHPGASPRASDPNQTRPRSDSQQLRPLVHHTLLKRRGPPFRKKSSSS